eukprot:92333-Prymnesium_polylepis.1
MIGDAEALNPGVLDASRRVRMASVSLLHHAKGHDHPAAPLATALPLQLRFHRLHGVELAGRPAAARLDFVSLVHLVGGDLHRASPRHLLAEHFVRLGAAVGCRRVGSSLLRR